MVKKIFLACAAILISLSVRGTSFVKTEGGRLVLGNEFTSLVFEPETLNLETWYDHVAGQNIYTGSGQSLFLLVLGNAPLNYWSSYRHSQLTQNIFPDRSWEAYSNEEGAGVLLFFNNAPVVDADAAVNAVVRVFLSHDSAIARWHIAVENNSPLPLEEVEFPRLGGINFPDSADSPEEEYVIVPLYSGIKCFSPRTAYITGQGMSNYPGGGLSVQLLIYSNDKGSSFYFAGYDSRNYAKTFNCSPAPGNTVFMSNLHYADGDPRQNSWSLPYEIAAGPVSGDWYDCAKIYRRWTLQFDRWKPLYLRDDIMPEFRDLAIWWSGHPLNMERAYGNGALAERICRIKNEIFPDVTMAYHWYIWYSTPRHDVDYPDVFYRLTENFDKDVARIQSAGVPAMLYSNILLYETFLPGWSEAQKWAGRNQFNELNKDVGRGMWHSGDPRFITGMCFGAHEWVEHITKVYKMQYEDLNCRFFYLDQLCNFPVRCFARNHGHQNSGGSYIADGEGQIARNIRNFAAPGSVAVVGEGLTECFIDTVDGLLNAHCDTDTTSVPLFQTIYSDRTTEIGVFVGIRDLEFAGTIPAKIAFNFVRGRQLGWMNEDQFDVLAPANRSYADYYACCARVRMAAPEYLFYGEMLREPLLDGVAVQEYQWYTHRLGSVDKMPLADVPAAAYRAPDGSIGVVLANHTDKKQFFKITPDWEDWQLVPDKGIEVSRLENGSWRHMDNISGDYATAVEMPPASATVIRFREMR